MKRVRVVIDARFLPGTVGGVETMVLGLAHGLAMLAPEDVDINFLTYAGVNQWIQPSLGRAIRTTEVAIPGLAHRFMRKSRVWGIRPAAGSFGVLPGRDGLLDRVAADVVHFPLQSGHRVRLPFIYQPHDLQHRHLPDFFKPRAIAKREVVYRYLCRSAAAVGVGTTWVKDDLISEYGIPPDKIYVIPLAPLPTGAATKGPPLDLDLSLPPKYVVYPAVPWPHKNHERLMEALAILRKRGIELPLVLTGGGRDRSTLLDVAARFTVSDLVVDLGYLSQEQVNGVISRALVMVVPTLFEAASFPVWEAFRLGTPVACSNVTSLPRQVGDAALIFDPYSAEAIADAVERLSRSSALREELTSSARSRVAAFTWERTARHFLALYRRVARVPLSREETALLESEPII